MYFLVPVPDEPVAPIQDEDQQISFQGEIGRETTVLFENVDEQISCQIGMESECFTWNIDISLIITVISWLFDLI